MADRASLKKLAEALGPLLGELVESASGIFGAPADDQCGRDAAINSSFMALRKFDIAARECDIEGLGGLVGFVYENLDALGKREFSEHGENWPELYTGWPLLLFSTLETPDDVEALGAFLVHCQDEGWPVAIEEDAAMGLATALMAEDSADDIAGDPETSESVQASSAGESIRDLPTSARPITIDVDSVDLRVSIPDDVNPLLVEAFMSEVPDRTADLAAAVQRISAGESDRDLLYDTQRIAHTIKGSANITGVPGVAQVTHYVEDILEHLCNTDTAADSETADILLQASDCLEAMMDHLNSGAPYPDDARHILGQLVRRYGALTGVATELNANVAAQPAAELSAAVIELPIRTSEQDSDETVAVQDGTEGKPLEEKIVAAGPVAEENVESTVRMGISRVDGLQRLAGEISISTFRLDGFRDDARRALLDLATQHATIRTRLEELENLVVLQGVPANATASGGAISEQDAEFDILEMDEYTELHSVTNALTEAVIDATEMAARIERRFRAFDDLLVDQDRVTRELNDSVMSIRTVSAEGLSPRLQRAVRQTCRTTGKKADLVIEGDDIDIDNDVVDALADPLMHILRNAIDHGLETPEDRIASGKNETGSMVVRFSRVADDVVVECRDDGRGFDFDAIRRKAKERNLIKPDEELDERELARLTLLPGFSTRDDVDQISGRGIGMNVVFQQVLDRRGSVDIDSTQGKGTSIVIRMPLSLISLHMILVTDAGRTYAVPSGNIDQLVVSDMGSFSVNDDGISRRWYFDTQGEQWQVRSLGELISGAPPVDNLDSVHEQPVMLLRTPDGNFAVTLEEATTAGRLVVKNFGNFIPRLPGVIGGSILADGNISPVLDLRDLVSAQITGSGFDAVRLESELQPAAIGDILVVDDSLSARRTLSQLMNDAGFETREARDGLEAAEMIDEKIPALVLTDMEMPRMNGIELVRHLRTTAETSDIPAIMITSRSTQKHREQALDAGVTNYVTKPWNEDGLVTIVTQHVFGTSEDVA